MKGNNFTAIVLVLALIFVISTIFLGKLKKRFIKYIPAILAASVTLAFYIKAYFFSEGFEALGYFVMMIISAASAVASIITSVIIEFIKRRK